MPHTPRPLPPQTGRERIARRRRMLNTFANMNGFDTWSRLETALLNGDIIITANAERKTAMSTPNRNRINARITAQDEFNAAMRVAHRMLLAGELTTAQYEHVRDRQQNELEAALDNNRPGTEPAA